MLKTCSRLLARQSQRITKVARAQTSARAVGGRQLSTVVPASDDSRFKDYQMEVDGEPGKEGFRIDYMSDGKQISPWHDIPMRFSGEPESRANFLCEIPRYSKAKLEISTGDKLNPLIQDRNKDGSLRDYHGPIFWYVCFLLLGNGLGSWLLFG